jgi:hypothetical protein
MLDGATMVVSLRLLVGVLALLLGATRVDAGRISITMTATTEVKDGNLSVVLKVGNSGDEAAGSVVPVLRLRDKEVRGTRHEALDPGASMEETLALPLGDLGPGRWPYRVAVDYTDANQYPFQALHAATFIVGSPGPAKIAVPEIVAPPLSESGDVSLTVKNLAGTARPATVTIYVPDGLEAPDATQKIDLPAWETAKVQTGLLNRTALAGSRYPIFVAVEYDDEGAHQTLVSSSTVEVQQHRALISRGLLWVVGGLLAAWAIVLILRRGKA